MGQSVKNNLPAMLVTWVPSLGWKDPLEDHSSSLARRIPKDRLLRRNYLCGSDPITQVL